MKVVFTVTEDERKDINAIVDRANKIAKAANHNLDRMSMVMDLMATHANGCPMDFAQLLAADDFNLAHDVFGIHRYLNRETGQLTDCFRPRFAAKQDAETKAH